ncbi:toll/interleukin-1 receptor domain-containing protein [Myxococcus sp. CA039A]|uniref:toll/interleukin-1 receptor domain-containing protein n=1 Tax=Myxococcus sp. CA039A TaxID=2741737 RepID=UPI00157B13A5|nr:toll/interleukin-1 receptor domain-containing protein [Myxococcus sp. CA039A]NTX56976.1 toll/interleukin-1 receptor domain-containing protein [Myxococcus sp. CA039A]
MSTAKRYMPPQSAKELLDRYAHGERYFVGAKADGLAILGGDSLSGVNLSRASVRDMGVGEGSLLNVSFRGADLTGFGTYDAEIVACDFRSANLDACDVTYSAVARCRLEKANLFMSRFLNVSFDGSRCFGAKLSNASFIDCDIRPFCDAEYPDSRIIWVHVDYRTIVRSILSPNLKDFLRRTEMPDVFVEYMVDSAHSLDEKQLFKLMMTTFISYGAPDEGFARNLYEALHRNGVKSFFFPAHAKPGVKLRRLMHEGINQYDRVILICSRSSLDRPGVLNEIQEALSRESRSGGLELLVPIRLDDYVLKGWTPLDSSIAQSIRDRVVADFEGTEKSPVKFERALHRLLAALKK